MYLKTKLIISVSLSLILCGFAKAQVLNVSAIVQGELKNATTELVAGTPVTLQFGYGITSGNIQSESASGGSYAWGFNSATEPGSAFINLTIGTLSFGSSYTGGPVGESGFADLAVATSSGFERIELSVTDQMGNAGVPADDLELGFQFGGVGMPPVEDFDTSSQAAWTNTLRAFDYDAPTEFLLTVDGDSSVFGSIGATSLTVTRTDSLTVVPEPSQVGLLLGVAICAIPLMRRRR